MDKMKIPFDLSSDSIDLEVKDKPQKFSLRKKRYNLTKMLILLKMSLEDGSTDVTINLVWLLSYNFYYLACHQRLESDVLSVLFKLFP